MPKLGCDSRPRQTEPPLNGAVPHGLRVTVKMTLMATQVVEKFRPTESSGTFSVFETTIRHLGGLMAAYELSGDASLLDRARDLGDHLMLAFRTPTGIPMGFCQLKTGSCTTASWMPGVRASSSWFSLCLCCCAHHLSVTATRVPFAAQRVFLADVGSLQLEMSALSFSTGNATYSDTAERAVMALLNSKQQPGGKAEGLLYRMYNPLDGAVMDDRVGMGAFSDSAYEYLLKLWVAGGRSPAVAPYWRRWEKMALAVDAVMVQTSSPGNLTYLADAFGPDFTPDRLLHELEHFACFAGGMFVLGAEGQHAERFLKLGRGIGETCYQMYARTATGLAPDRVYFRRGGEDDFTVGDPRNCLRPETVESLFYLYRKTGEQKYRDQGWAIFQAFEKHSKAKGGYSGLRDVRNVPAAHDGIQQSFFLAETLKYLYLLFADGNTVHLDEWVFNTEAHLMRVRARQSSLYTYP